MFTRARYIYQKGALTLAEGSPKHKTNVSLVMKNDINPKILRTSFDPLSVWKSKHVEISTSAFGIQTGNAAAIIDGEVWTYGVDATNKSHLVRAVKIAQTHYKLPTEKAGHIISNVYIKNLNTEGENGMTNPALIDANKELYTGVCLAVVGAAHELQVTGEINLWVISNNLNPKIPRDALYAALRAGGAASVETDEEEHKFISGNNEGTAHVEIKTHIHLATFKL